MSATTWQAQLHDNVAAVRARIAEAASRAGRSPNEVRLVGVTKYVGADVLRELIRTGVSDLGESRVQQLVARATDCGSAAPDWPTGPAENAAPSPRWHMIGHLQRNKVGQLLSRARILHSLDSLRLLKTLEEQATRMDVSVDAFLEVNVSGEASKQGVTAKETDPLIEAVAGCSRVRLRGLMTMAPYDPDPEASRAIYARLRELLEQLQARGVAPETCVHLSMGMSQDYAVAVEEGATFVRVGSALFTGLPSEDPRAH